MPSLRQQLGKRLLAIRQERVLTQEAFSELVGISVDFLSLIERGRNAPSFEVLAKMSHRLRLPGTRLVRLHCATGEIAAVGMTYHSASASGWQATV